MTFRWLLGAAPGALLVLATLHCGESSPPADVSCVLVSSGGATTCTDTSGLTGSQVTTLRGQCLAEADGGIITTGDASPVVYTGGSFATSPCDQTGVIGGCELDGLGYTSTIWTYASTGDAGPQVTVQSVQTQCTQLYHGQFVAP